MAFSCTDLYQLDDILLLNDLPCEDTPSNPPYDYHTPSNYPYYGPSQLINHNEDSTLQSLIEPSGSLSANAQLEQNSDTNCSIDNSISSFIITSSTGSVLDDYYSTSFHSSNYSDHVNFTTPPTLANYSINNQSLHHNYTGDGVKFSISYSKVNTATQNDKLPTNHSIRACSNFNDERAFAGACISALSAGISRAPDLSMNALINGKVATYLKGSLEQPKGIKSVHVVSESIRRKQMTRLFHALRAALPRTIPQNDRCNVIDETCDYIKRLEKELQILKRKAAMLRSESEIKSLNSVVILRIKQSSLCDNDNHGSYTPISCTISLTSFSQGLRTVQEEEGLMRDVHVQVMSGGGGGKVVHISVGFYEKRPGLFPKILSIMEKRGLEMLNANYSQSQQSVLCAIHAKANNTLSLGNLEKELYIEATSNM